LTAVPQTLTDLIAVHAHSRAEAPALIYRDQPLSYAALEAESDRLACGLRDIGIVAGDRVAVWLPNTPAWIAALVACARLGAIVVATNTRFRSTEMADLLERTAPKVLLLWPGFRKIDFLSILEDVPAQNLRSLAAIVAYSEDETQQPRQRFRDIPVRAYGDVTSGAAADASAASPEAGCVLFNTSGTTKAPKFVLHNQRSIAVHAHDVARGFRYVEPDTVVLGVVPFCGVYGFVTMTAALAAGAPLVVASSFNAQETLSAIERYRVTSMNLTGDMLAQIIPLAHDERAFASVRFCGSGTGAPQYSAPAAEKGLTVTGLYGSSEVQALFSRQDESISLPERAQGGGLPVTLEAHVRTRNPDTGVLLGHGEHGMLEMRAPSMLMGYFGDEAATAAALTEDGYFKTGDLGYTLEDGRFVYLARMGDTLRLSGFLVSPAQIEEVVNEHPEVASCQVVGVELEQALRSIAFVVLAPGAAFDEPAILEHCRHRMARYKVPHRVFALERFPTTDGPNGVKVRKEALRELGRNLCASGAMASDAGA
jgi:fatty-acyl-CoA synthase